MDLKKHGPLVQVLAAALHVLEFIGRIIAVLFLAGLLMYLAVKHPIERKCQGPQELPEVYGEK